MWRNCGFSRFELQGFICLGKKPCNFRSPVKPHSRAPEQDDLLCPRLIDARHEPVDLAALIDWAFFERDWARFFPVPQGRPAAPPYLVAGLIYLQRAFRLSDEAVISRWVESPCCGKVPPDCALIQALHRRDALSAPPGDRPVFADALVQADR